MSTFPRAFQGPLHLIAAALAALSSAAACDSGDTRESVYPSAALVVLTSALSLTPGTVKSANGTYTNCTARTGPWSLTVSAGAALTYPALSVVKGNAACVLTLTSIVADQEYLATPAIAMTGAYKPTSSSFQVAAAPIAFYGNAYLSALTFAADFVVVILYSDSPNVSTVDNTANFTVQAGSATAAGVPAPSYTINLVPLVVSTDNANIVQTATGQALLTDGPVAGQNYVVLTALASTSYANIDAAFKAGTKTAITGPNPQVPAAAFSLIGVDLSLPAKVRYIVVANTTSDVPSYQVFAVTFHAPVP